jgi:hypothetical protein
MNNLEYHVISVLEELERLTALIQAQDSTDYNRGRLDALRAAHGMIEHALTCRQVVMDTSH